MALTRPDTKLDVTPTYIMVDGDNMLRCTWEAAPGECVTILEKKLRALSMRWANAKKLLIWDGPTADKYRQALYPDYKAHRPPTPESYVFMRRNAPKLAGRNGWQSWTCEHAEADDVIGSLSRSAVKTGSRVIIVSGDKDLYQLLVNDNVYQVRSFHAEAGDMVDIKQMTAKVLFAEHGVKASQWPLYRAIVGDKSDGIPGVVDVGDKSVEGMFREFPGLTADNLATAMREVGFASLTSSRREKLAAAIEDGTVALMLKLTTLRRIARGDIHRLS